VALIVAEWAVSANVTKVVISTPERRQISSPRFRRLRKEMQVFRPVSFLYSSERTRWFRSKYFRRKLMLCSLPEEFNYMSWNSCVTWSCVLTGEALPSLKTNAYTSLPLRMAN
jgi:hypothetical protein